MKTQTESIWHDSRTDSMVLADPGHGKGAYKVDDAQAAAEFWNTNKNAAASLLRDPYNGHYWGTSEARAEFLTNLQPSADPVAEPPTVPVQPPVSRGLGAAVQLWEPCEQCGAEPAYQTASGHLCKNCQH